MIGRTGRADRLAFTLDRIYASGYDQVEGARRLSADSLMNSFTNILDKNFL